MRQPRVLMSLVPALILALAAPALAGTPIRVLVDGAAIQGSNGLAVGPDGLLYVASVAGREIVVVNRFTGAVTGRLGTEIGVETPDDVAFGPDGSLYWTGFFAGEVGRLRPDGTASIIAQLPVGVNPIAFNDEGRLFVGLVAFGDALYELDPEGVQPPQLILEPAGGLNGFSFGPDGLLYTPYQSAGAVARIDVDAATVDVFAPGFVLPVAVEFDSQGRLYVNDAGTEEIVRLDVVTGAREVFAELDDTTDNITFDDNDNLYATSLVQGSVRKVRQNGSVRTVVPGGMTVPGGVAVLPAGRFGLRDEVWVADFFSLRAFGPYFGNERAFYPATPGISPITGPTTVAADGEDNLILSSWLLNQVQVVEAASGQVLQSVQDFAVPLNAIRFDGDLVVAELGFPPGGAAVVRADGADPSQRTVLAAGLAVPTGLASAGDDLWFADYVFGTVFQVVAAGQVLSPPLPVAGGLALPEGLAVLPSGDLLVVETGAGRLSRIDLSTGAVSTVADGLELGTSIPNAPPTWAFNGVAVGRRGAVYVSGDASNKLYKLRVF